MDKPQIQSVIDIARQAGERIMHYRGKVQSTAKDDGSPVTIADKEASDIIMQGLKALTPDIPVISEEASMQDNLKAAQAERFWVTDPLDGTRTYLNGKDGFGVHIALIDKGVPVMGVAFFPAQGENQCGRLYFTGDDGAAYIREGKSPAQKVSAISEFSKDKFTVSVSHKKHRQPPDIKGHFYKAVGGTGGERICHAAAGMADIAWMVRENVKWSYSWWDVAASHAILRAAGGELVEKDTGKPFRYKGNILATPDLIAGHKNMLKTLKFTPQP